MLRAGRILRIATQTGLVVILLYAVGEGLIALVRELLEPWPAVARQWAGRAGVAERRAGRGATAGRRAAGGAQARRRARGAAPCRRAGGAAARTRR